MKIFYISATNPVGCVLSNGANRWDEDYMIVGRIIRNGRKNQPFDFPRSKAQGLPSARAQAEGSGLILSGALDPILKDDVWRRRSIKIRNLQNVFKGILSIRFQTI